MLLYKEIVRLQQQLLNLAAMVEEQVYLAVQSIETRNDKLAGRVIAIDGDVDEYEVALEEECLQVLARYQPFAADLRVIISVLKINNDLERIGDLAVNIAEQGKLFAIQKAVAMPSHIPNMARSTQTMLQKSLDALVNLDIHLAREVCAADQTVDNLHVLMFQTVEHAIQNHPETIQQCTGYLNVSRNLERIADHATNIAEDVIYLVEGTIVRHSEDLASVSRA